MRKMETAAKEAPPWNGGEVSRHPPHLTFQQPRLLAVSLLPLSSPVPELTPWAQPAPPRMNGAGNLHPLHAGPTQHGGHQVPASHERSAPVCFSPAPGPAAPELRWHGDGARPDRHLAHLQGPRRVRAHRHGRHWDLASHSLRSQRTPRRVSLDSFLQWFCLFYFQGSFAFVYIFTWVLLGSFTLSLR